MSDFLDLQGAKDLNADAIHIGAVANSKDPVTGEAIDTHVNRAGGTDYTVQGFWNALQLQFGDQLSNLQPWATAPTQDAAQTALGMSESGKTVATGTPAQGRTALELGSRTISASGDGSWSVSFDGTANATAALTLANSGVTAGTYGKVTVDSKGRVTAGTALSLADVTTALGYTPQNEAQRNVANGYAGLDAAGKLSASQLPAIAITDTFIVASQAAMLALTAERGDVAVRTDINKSFILKDDNATLLASWTELLTPTDAVLSVNGQTGPVVLSAADVGAQPFDADLEAIAALSGTSGLARKTATNTWVLDTATYLTGNQSISITGDATGSGTTSIPITLSNSGVTSGTYPKVTVNAKGIVTNGAALLATDIPPLDWSKITTGKPTTLSGYGITDAQPADATLTAMAGVTTAADRIIYFTGVDVAAQTPLTAFGRSLIDDADASTALTTLGVSAFAKTLLDDADAETARKTLGALSATESLGLDANLFTESALFRLMGSGWANIPTGGEGLGDHILNARWDRNAGAQLYLPFVNSKALAWRRKAAGVYSSWMAIYHEGNTTVDSNGFLKNASPIINLYSDRMETEADGAFERLGTGHYQLTGCNGLRLDDGWYIETPHDRNGNKYFNVEWEQDLEPENEDGVLDEPADVTLTVRCYERVWNPQTGQYDNGSPVDIPEGRWIDLRMNEVRQPEIEMDASNERATDVR